ncbi:hypothetical protein NECID01_0193 [Nematocida sp. AWRm77]|nr:hypothetical protein NECID01_0193 [Nematocida sp. AWRm77]
MDHSINHHSSTNQPQSEESRRRFESVYADLCTKLQGNAEDSKWRFFYLNRLALTENIEGTKQLMEEAVGEYGFSSSAYISRLDSLLEAQEENGISLAQYTTEANKYAEEMFYSDIRRNQMYTEEQKEDMINNIRAVLRITTSAYHQLQVLERKKPSTLLKQAEALRDKYNAEDVEGVEDVEDTENAEDTENTRVGRREQVWEDLQKLYTYFTKDTFYTHTDNLYLSSRNDTEVDIQHKINRNMMKAIYRIQETVLPRPEITLRSITNINILNKYVEYAELFASDFSPEYTAKLDALKKHQSKKTVSHQRLQKGKQVVYSAGDVLFSVLVVGHLLYLACRMVSARVPFLTSLLEHLSMYNYTIVGVCALITHVLVVLIYNAENPFSRPIDARCLSISLGLPPSESASSKKESTYLKTMWCTVKTAIQSLLKYTIYRIPSLAVIMLVFLGVFLLTNKSLSYPVHITLFIMYILGGFYNLFLFWRVPRLDSSEHAHKLEYYAQLGLRSFLCVSSFFLAVHALVSMSYLKQIDGTLSIANAISKVDSVYLKGTLSKAAEGISQEASHLHKRLAGL